MGVCWALRQVRPSPGPLDWWAPRNKEECLPGPLRGCGPERGPSWPGVEVNIPDPEKLKGLALCSSKAQENTDRAQDSPTSGLLPSLPHR